MAAMGVVHLPTASIPPHRSPDNHRTGRRPVRATAYQSCKRAGRATPGREMCLIEGATLVEA